MRASLTFLLASVGLVIAACSDSGDVNTTFSSDTGGAGGGGGAGAGGPVSSASGSSAQSSASSAASSSSSSSSSGASSSSSSGGSACDYDAPNTCPNATEISAIDGDGGADLRTVSGTTSKWFKVFVIDTFNTSSNNMSYTATLQSPPGMDFDLFAYPGTIDTPDCFAEVLHATGSPESVGEYWDDEVGTDQDRWIVLEVRYISGTACGNAAKWTLTVEGNTNP